MTVIRYNLGIFNILQLFLNQNFFRDLPIKKKSPENRQRIRAIKGDYFKNKKVYLSGKFNNFPIQKFFHF